MINLDIRSVVRTTIELCFGKEDVQKNDYISIALVLEKQGGINPDLIMYYGAINSSLKDDVTIYGEDILAKDISCEDFTNIVTVIYSDYRANFQPIIPKIMIDIIELTNDYDGLMSAIKYCYGKNDFARAGIGFKIFFDLIKK